MKVHYINILLFAVLFNILVNTHKKPFITHHTPKISITRLLCECELYAPANYDNDTQMKAVMENFNKQTQQRFHEYDERLQEKRMQCKEQCDKKSEKIILKDKLEKELMDKFVTLQTDVQSDAIPTCICKKSIAGKVEKGCLRCGGVLGGTLPELGLMGGTALYTLNAWKVAALKYAISAAKKAGAAKGLAEGNALGIEIVNTYLKKLGVENFVPGICEEISSAGHFTKVIDFANTIITKKAQACTVTSSGKDTMCLNFDLGFGIRIRTVGGFENGPPATVRVPEVLEKLVGEAKQAADALAKNTAKKVTADLTAEKTGEIAATYGAWKTTIIASVVAIVIIILIMVIIYKILRYRRKKKMKKKLQYIKLLEE
ncbi:rifin PIR protein, putative [Plasmodium reichenowi]|uniref:Rifin PIR protein, putative n=1 Tax=Plasmodium reichenowi TaxID=5854 RepID=A0A2P9DT74_PLARE|nr:rifin PIR protein, putative [Plasmodium reichenowi]